VSPRKFRRKSGFGLAIVVASAFVACDSAPSPTPSFPPSPGPSPTVPSHPAPASPRSLTPGELADSIRFREDFGLRADEEWIRTIAAQPNADWTTYAVPVTPAELVELNDRAVAADAVSPIATGYGQKHPADWAGVWIDNANGGVVVIQFSAQLDEHRRAILQQIGPAAGVSFREVRFSLEQLEAGAGRLKGTDSWFKTLPAVLTSYGVDVSANSLLIRISSINPEIDETILGHFGWAAGFAKIESDGTGAELIRRGTLRIAVTDARGRPIRGVQCIPHSDLTGADIVELPIPVTNADGVCVIRNLVATGYWVHVQRDTAGPGFDVLGFVRGTVVADETTEARLSIK
jgi:hypothetical protein